MRENRIRTIWKAGGAVLNGWLAIPTAFSAETMAHQGWDSLTIDLQHGVVDYQAAINMLTAISTTDTVPVVRVPWLEPGILMKMLDAGAYALICPMVNTREDAERLVAVTHYAPRGTRSFGPIRALLYGGTDYPKHANDTIVVFAMIETKQALDNLDDIMSVKGLDAVYIGPSDLSISLGYAPGGDKPDEWMMTALKKVLDGCKRHKVQPGIHCGAPAYAKKMIEMGFTFVTVGGDNRFMTLGGQAAVAEMKDAPKPGAGGSVY